jgi:hypothetical protein
VKVGSFYISLEEFFYQPVQISGMQRRPTKRAPDGWDSVRFFELFLNFGSFPFRELFLPSRR